MVSIIIIEDSPEDARLFVRLLQQCRILNPVTMFRNGDEFIPFLREQANGGASQPCLIFLDLVMSPVSGLEVLAEWSKSALARRSLVVMMSGLTDLKAINAGYQSGAKTFLVKPVSKDELLQTVSALGTVLEASETTEGYVLQWIGEEDGGAFSEPVATGSDRTRAIPA